MAKLNARGVFPRMKLKQISFRSAKSPLAVFGDIDSIDAIATKKINAHEDEWISTDQIIDFEQDSKVGLRLFVESLQKVIEKTKLNVRPGFMTGLLTGKSFEDVALYLEDNMILDTSEEDRATFRKHVCWARNWRPWATAEVVVCDLVETAESGDRDAQMAAAWNYFYGESGFPVNYDECTRFFTLAAEQGVADARRMLGDFYSIGIARPRSFARARELFEQAAESGLASARCRYGLFLEWWNRSIATSRQQAFDYMPYLTGHDSEALYRLGNVLEPPKLTKLSDELKKGHLVNWDMDRALRSYRDATALGNLEAFRRLLHVHGQLGQGSQIAQSYFFQYLCLQERAIVRKICEVLPPDYPHLAMAIHLAQPKTEDESTLENRADKLIASFSDEESYRWRATEIAGQLKQLEDLYTNNKELVHRYTDGADNEQVLRTEGAIDFHYRRVIQRIAHLPESEADRKKIMRQSVLGYAKWLHKQGRFAAMFRQYYKISQPPKASKVAVYKTGKYLLSPKGNSCVRNPTLGIKLLKQAVEKGFPGAPFHIGCYQIDERDLEEGLDNLILSFRMGYVRGLFKYIYTLDTMGGPRRYPGQHFSMLLDAYRTLKHQLASPLPDKKRAAMEQDLKTCTKRLRSRPYAKYQFREGRRLLRLSVEAAKPFMTLASTNGHPHAQRMFQAPLREKDLPHREPSCPGKWGPFQLQPWVCDVCGKNDFLPQRHCSECSFDVCIMCTGGMYYMYVANAGQH
jgi:TPR repeat protein